MDYDKGIFLTAWQIILKNQTEKKLLNTFFKFY